MKKNLISVLAIVLTICFLTNSVFADGDSFNGVLEKGKEIVNNIVEAIKESVLGFSDTAYHWAKGYIEQLTSIKAIKGYLDGTFKPDNPITRAEFTAILLRAQNDDVGQPPAGNWYDNYIKEATQKEYILSGEFDDVNKNITRGEMARMIVRAMNETYPANMVDYKSMIKDYSTIPAEYRDFVLKAYVTGIITGRPDGKFYYADTATRAEATAMIVRLTDKNKRMVPDLKEEEKIVIDGQEIPVSNTQIIPYYNKVLELFKSNVPYITENYDGRDEVYLHYLPAANVYYINSSLKFGAWTENKAEYQYSIVLRKHDDEKAKYLLKETLKIFFPKNYEKILNEFENLIWTGKSIEGTADGRKYWIDSFPTTTQVCIGGEE